GAGGGFVEEPVVGRIGDGFRRAAEHPVAARRGGQVVKIAQRHVFAARRLVEDPRERLAALARRWRGNRSVERIPSHVVPDPAGHQRERIRRCQPALQPRELLARLALGAADDRHHAGQHRDRGERRCFASRLFRSRYASLALASSCTTENTTSDVRAASSRPASEPPAWMMTGWPCGLRAMLIGPLTWKKRPSWFSGRTFVGSMNRPVALSATIAPSSQQSQSPLTTSTNSCATS